MRGAAPGNRGFEKIGGTESRAFKDRRMANLMIKHEADGLIQSARIKFRRAARMRSLCGRMAASTAYRQKQTAGGGTPAAAKNLLTMKQLLKREATHEDDMAMTKNVRRFLGSRSGVKRPPHGGRRHGHLVG